MNMKRIIKGTLITIGMILATTITVSAYHDGTPRAISPAFKLDKWVYGPAVSITSSLRTPYRSNVYLFVTGLGELENSYQPNSGRTFPIEIKDQDGWNNDDDTCKRYTGVFNRRRLASVRFDSVYNDQSIDSTGESTVEMYVIGKLGRISGDRELSGGTNLFYYQIFID